jgi:hypothetical protein
VATLTEALREAYATAPPSAVVLHTMELWHPTWEAALRLVADFADLTATLEDDAPVNGGEEVLFTGCPFSFTLPQVGEGRQELSIQFDNVAQLLMPLLEAADLTSETPIRATYRPYLSSATDAPQMSPVLTLDVIRISADVMQVTCVCAHADHLNRKFPRRLYTVEEFPGVAPRV